MIQLPIEFNRIYFNIDNSGYINLWFIDSQNEINLFFDGINFFYKTEINSFENYSLLKYNSDSISLFIDKIAQDFDIYFIQISNGDIFQISPKFHDERLDQRIDIFNDESKEISTPLGISLYESVAKNANEADDVEVIA